MDSGTRNANEPIHLYGNEFGIGGVGGDIALLVRRVTQLDDGIDRDLQAVIHMSAFTAKQLMKLLVLRMEQFEQPFGPISDAPDPKMVEELRRTGIISDVGPRDPG